MPDLVLIDHMASCRLKNLSDLSFLSFHSNVFFLGSRNENHFPQSLVGIESVAVFCLCYFLDLQATMLK